MYNIFSPNILPVMQHFTWNHTSLCFDHTITSQWQPSISFFNLCTDCYNRYTLIKKPRTSCSDWKGTPSFPHFHMLLPPAMFYFCLSLSVSQQQHVHSIPQSITALSPARNCFTCFNQKSWQQKSYWSGNYHLWNNNHLQKTPCSKALLAPMTSPVFVCVC